MGRIPAEFNTKNRGAARESLNLGNNLAMLRLASEKAEENRFFHLDFHPKNILFSQETIGVIDFELSASVGDPTYEIGAFLGQYIYWSVMNTSGRVSQNAIHTILETYQHQVGDLWNTRQSRVVRFAGATVLSLLIEETNIAEHDFRNILMCTAKTLLA